MPILFWLFGSLFVNYQMLIFFVQTQAEFQYFVPIIFFGDKIKRNLIEVFPELSLRLIQFPAIYLILCDYFQH